jgi:hypothetical protein
VRASRCVSINDSPFRTELGLRQDVIGRYSWTRIGVRQAATCACLRVGKGVATGAREDNDSGRLNQERATPDHASNDNKCVMRMQRPSSG